MTPRVRLDISLSLDGFVAGPTPTLEEPLGAGGELLHEFRSDDEGDEEGDAEGAPIALSPDAKLVAANMPGVRVWESTTGKLVANLPAKADISCLAFSPDGKLLAAGSEDAVVVYEVGGARK